MKLSGRLRLSKKDDYIIITGGRTVNLNEFLNDLLFENIKFKLVHSYSKKVLFDVEGKLIKEKVAKCLYLYYVDEFDIDSILWDSVGSKLEFEIEDITKK